MNIGPMEWFLMAVLVGLPLMALAALVTLMRRARKTESPAEQQRIRELEARVQALEQQKQRRG